MAGALTAASDGQALPLLLPRPRMLPDGAGADVSLETLDALGAAKGTASGIDGGAACTCAVHETSAQSQ